MKFRVLAALFAVLALFAAACGNDTTTTANVTGSAGDEASSEDGDAMEDEAMEDEESDAMEDEDSDAMEDEAMEDEESDAMEDEAVVGEPAEDAGQRIVSLSPTSTEMLFAIGAGDLLSLIHISEPTRPY